MDKVFEDLNLSRSFLNELLTIAQKCNDNDTDECILDITTTLGTMSVKMEFSYLFK
ncbi:MAG: hypothetical protein J6T10_29920 [Methanobrevibacter sp.]|nr:hypothetical protein [Methanobrevibacter sp.]